MTWLIELVTFRNGNHLIYFLLTFPLLIWLAFSTLFRTLHAPYFILPMVSIIYASIAFMAYNVVIIEQNQSKVYSVDCIWYNSFLSVCYMVMFIVCLYRHLKQ